MKQGWEIKKLSDIGKIFNGNSINEKVKKDKYTNLDEGFPFIATKDVGFDSVIDYENGVRIPLKEINQFKIAPAKTPLICAEGGSAGRKIGFTNQDVCFGNKLFVLVPNKNIDAKYVFYYYFTSSFQKHFSTEIAGIIGGVSMNKFKDIEIPIPPLAEQQRIVSILDECFVNIEKAKTNTEQNLNNAKELFDSFLWNQLNGQEYESTSTKESAKNLFEKLALAKNQLIKKGSLPNKKDKHQDPIVKTQFRLPDNWRWCYLSDISIIQEGPGIRKHQYTKSGVQFLTVTNILEGKVDLTNSVKFISLNEYNKYKHFTINKGDIVTACSGGSWGKSAIFDSEETIILNTSTLRLRYFNDLALNKHLYYVSKTKFFKNQLSKHSTGQQPNYGYFHYSQIEIPLPPVEIQYKIVEKIELMESECNKLIVKYKSELINLEELKKSILEKAFSGHL